MNEEELRALVARAGDAERSLSPPPPDLLDQAQTATRHRRRLVTTAASALAAVVVLASVAVPRLLADRTDPVIDNSIPAVDTGELDEHGGPCPSILPDPVDDVDGHGFGTRTPADREPRLAPPETAWICQYDAQTIGRTDSGGTMYEWTRTSAPRRIDDALLPQVTDAMNGIAVDTDSEEELCPADLGPRYALISSAGGDLTGIVVDDYGCEEVRLTDNPFVTSPGDPQEGGTVPGVLTGADGFAKNLSTWWDTSPSDTGAGPAPDELWVTCTNEGPQVETTAVIATPAGVVVDAESTIANERGYLTYTSEGLSGGDAVKQLPKPATYQFPPGDVTLGCTSPPGMEETKTVTIEVLDPHRYWRGSTLGDFGCTGGSTPTWRVGDGTGATPREAVAGLLAAFAERANRSLRDFTAQPARTGYSGADTQTWVGYRDGTPYLSILVTRSDTTFTANPSMLCDQS